MYESNSDLSLTYFYKKSQNEPLECPSFIKPAANTRTILYSEIKRSNVPNIKIIFHQGMATLDWSGTATPWHWYYTLNKNHKLCTTIKYQKDKYLPPGNGHTWLKWHLHPVTFQGHVNQPHCNVLGLVEQAQVSMVTILQKRPSWASYGSCLPFKGLKPVLQKLQIMEQVLKWYILIFFYIKFLKLILNII